MNAFGYFFHRIGLKLGLLSERHRWGAINRETQILSEAEDLLGRLAWPDVKDIDDRNVKMIQLKGSSGSVVISLNEVKKDLAIAMKR